MSTPKSITGLTTAFDLPVPICTPGWREALRGSSVLPEIKRQSPWPGLELRPLEPEASASSMRPPRLHCSWYSSCPASSSRICNKSMTSPNNSQRKKQPQMIHHWQLILSRRIHKKGKENHTHIFRNNITVKRVRELTILPLDLPLSDPLLTTRYP